MSNISAKNNAILDSFYAENPDAASITHKIGRGSTKQLVGGGYGNYEQNILTARDANGKMIGIKGVQHSAAYDPENPGFMAESFEVDAQDWLRRHGM